MRALSAGLVVGCSAYLASQWYLRYLRAKHGVVVSLFQYIRLCYRLREPSSLMLIADFDRTLTTSACGTSCHGVVESCKELSAEYRAATKALVEHYLPIETTPTMPRAEKIPLMQDWYRQAHTLLLKEPLTPALLDSAARESKIALRPGTDAMLAKCHELGIPFIVMSAGLGNVIEAVMRQRLSEATAAQVTPTLPIVSNWLRFDARGVVCGFSQPLLHMFNKDGSFIRSQLGEERLAELRRGRRTIVLLGDGLGDAQMADGLDADLAVVKIGLLNESDEARVAARLPQYEAAFDVVLLGDGSFEWVLQLLGLQ